MPARAMPATGPPMTNPNKAIADICDAILQRQRFVLTSHARPDGDAIGSQLAMAYALKALGKDRAVRRPRSGTAAISDVSRSERDGNGVIGRRSVRRGHRDGVRRSVADRRHGLREVFRHQHRSPSRQHHVRRHQLVRRIRGRLRRNGVRCDRRAEGAAHAGDRHAHLHRDPHRHRRLPFLAHHAAHVRDLQALHRSRAPGRKRSPAPSTTAARSAG